MSRVNLIIIFAVCIFFSACDPTTEADVTIYSTNKTAKDFKIKVVNNTLNTSSSIVDVSSATSNIKVLDYAMFESTGYAGVGCISIYLYNCIDSTYIILDNCNENRTEYLKYVSEEKSATDNNAKRYDINVNISITPEILSVMNKNINFTDSIFELKD